MAARDGVVTRNTLAILKKTNNKIITMKTALYSPPSQLLSPIRLSPKPSIPTIQPSCLISSLPYQPTFLHFFFLNGKFYILTLCFTGYDTSHLNYLSHLPIHPHNVPIPSLPPLPSARLLFPIPTYCNPCDSYYLRPKLTIHLPRH